DFLKLAGAAGSLSKLSTLHLSWYYNENFPTEIFNVLESNCRNITSMTISHPSKKEDINVALLIKAQNNLDTISLISPDSSSQNILSAIRSNMKNLKRLQLSGCQKVSLDFFSEAGNLQRLSMVNIKVEGLNTKRVVEFVR